MDTNTLPNESSEVSAESALAIKSKENEVKMLQCKAEIEAVLKKYNCSMRVGPPTVEITLSHVPVEPPK